jgi:hypothetical protein
MAVGPLTVFYILVFIYLYSLTTCDVTFYCPLSLLLFAF